jgi:acetate kinase
VADEIVVLNAGSSSLKLPVFVARGVGLEPDLRGNIEETDTAPRFVAKDRAGHVLDEKSWGERARLGHEGALDHVLAFPSGEFADDRLVGVGHRVVHGGATYTTPLRLDRSVLAALEQLVPLARELDA